MIQIGKTIVSTDLIERRFFCDLDKCKGICCVEGDSGAPLEDEETKILEEIYPIFKKYLSAKNIKAVKEQGIWLIDSDNDKVTPLVDGKECAYVYYDKDIAKCAIERAFYEGLIKFKKPISCHLYPVRTKKFEKFEAVNYHRWEKCKPAVDTGKEKDVRAYQFLKEPLARRYGKNWYKELCLVAEEYSKAKGSSQSSR